MYPYSGPRLIELLEKKHQSRSQSVLFRKGRFEIVWRAKVGSFPHPDLETMISAGEPSGAWRTVRVQKKERDETGQWRTYEIDSRPEDKRNVGENWQALKLLPLNAYIPGASIRGIVRAWASQRPQIKARMLELLGQQNDNEIASGKIEFLDAFPQVPTQPCLDIVNPQQGFQVFHEGQGTPLSLYTLGNGRDIVPFIVAIRGIQSKHTTSDEVEEVWQWTQQALSEHGLGSRTASGYGKIKAPANFKPNASLKKANPEISTKILSFELYSQGNAGPETKSIELRPSHWRGWLRSWLLRFFLGVMTREDAKATVAELLGTLEESAEGSSQKGLVRIELIEESPWGMESQTGGFAGFYYWKGRFKITAPKTTLREIIIPILRFAVMVGGLGRGWRRPLHLFRIPKGLRKGELASRGSNLKVTHRVKKNKEWIERPFGLAPEFEEWKKLYDRWSDAVHQQWRDRHQMQPNDELNAEIFSPYHCAVFMVPGEVHNPIDPEAMDWITVETVDTRGKGVELIYKSQYKGKPDVGGRAGDGKASCSWVSIKSLKGKNGQKEMVCLFLGRTEIDHENLRFQFLQELANISGSSHVFGVKSVQIIN